MNDADRGQWKSRLGFILAASGSAIGLGNIVFFGANAYRYGGGAFYLPYFVALFVVGIPILILEFGIGHRSRRALPQTLRNMSGGFGEFVGWWAIINATLIMMYYVTLLGWVLGMLVGAFGPLWTPTHPTPGYTHEVMPNPYGYFSATIASFWSVLFVAIVWLANVLLCAKGTKTIEAAVKFFVPAIWIMMIVLIVRGLTLPGGWDGVMYLFNPDFTAMKEPEVWKGAFSQMFFTLSLGCGALTVYASYLPKDSDSPSLGIQTALMNCSFEYIAGIAIFAILFAVAVVPKASFIAMTFFVLPAGIAQLPAGVLIFGILFFVLLLFAGLSSSMSLVEAIAAAAIDKFGIRRRTVLIALFGIGFGGSLVFALPNIIDPDVKVAGTAGAILMDLLDNKAFGYGLLLVGLAECILVGWVFGAEKLTAHINQFSRIRLGAGFCILIRYVIPITILILLGAGIWTEAQDFPYGRAAVDPEVIGTSGWQWVAWAIPLLWLGITVGVSILLTVLPGRKEPA